MGLLDATLLLRTAAACAFRPEKTFQEFRWEGGAALPLLYVLCLGGPSFAAGYVIETWAVGGELRGALSPGVALALFFLPPLYVWVKAQLLHLALILQQVASRPFVCTLRGVAYANGSIAPVCLLPLAGGFVFLAWATVLEATAVRHAHGLSVGRAALSALVPAGVAGAVLIAKAILVTVTGGGV